MRWVIGTVGVLVGLVAVVLIVGSLLPKAHVVARSAVYAAAPEALWASLINTRAFPTWRTGLARVETLPDENGQRGWREHGKDGVIPYRVVESVAPRRLVTRIADAKLPFGGTWTYELVPTETGTRLTITERGEIYNPLFRFVSRFFLGYTSTMDGVLRSLGTKHGETVTPESAGSVSVTA
jgi:uncharacterized protein YndB with AHSA1/START domain